MDQAVLDLCKRRYKRKLLAHIILENESTDKPVPEILKAITMKDVVYWIAAAWEEASPESLRKAWRNLLHESDPDDGVSDNDDVSPDSSIADAVLTAAPLGKVTEEAVAKWMEEDISEPGHQVLDDDEIVAEMLECEEDHDEEKVLMWKLLPVNLSLLVKHLMLWMLHYIGWSKQVQMLLTCC